jgi:two-component system, cell cycle sensor histidine kinase and response regulator CckA
MRNSEHKQAVETLSDSQAGLAGIVNSAMDAIISTDSEQKIVLFNAAAEKMFHCSAATAMGQLLDRFIPTRFVERHQQHIKDVENTGVTLRSRGLPGALTGLRADGEEFPLEASLSQIEVAGQKLFTVILRDITERKHAEEALLEASQFNRQVIAGAREGIVVLDRDLRYQVFNPYMEEITARRAETVLGRTVEEVIPAPQGALVAARLRRALAGETVLSGDQFRHGTKEHPARWVTSKSSPLFNAKGEIIGVIGVIHDLTERKQAEQLIAEWNNRYEAIINASGQILYDWDPNTNEVTYGGNFQHVLGYSTEEMAGGLAHWSQLIHREDVEAFHQEIERVIETGESFHLEYRVQRKDGSYMFVDDQGYFFLDAHGDVARMVGFVRDITKRRRAEAALRESEDRYRDLVEHSHDLICTHDLQGQILSINRTAGKLLGADQDRLLNKNICDILIPEFRNRFADYIAELQKNGSARGVMSVRTSAGEKRIWEYSNTLRTEGVSAPIVRGIAHDVTERKLAEAALKHSEERFRALTENTADLIAILDADATMRYISPSVYRMLGYTVEEWLGRNAFEFIHPDDAQAAAEALQKGIQHQDTGLPLEFRVRHQNGSWRVIEATDTNLLENDAVAGIVINARDITDRKRSEEALRKAEEKYRSIFENAVEGIFQYTPDGRFISVNPALARILAYESPEELIALRTDIKVQHYVDPNCQMELKRMLAEKGAVLGFECEIFRKDLSKIWCVENLRAICDESGAVAYYEGSIEEITERKQLEAQLRQAQKMEAVGQLAGGIAHDFNNLLTAINGYSELTMMQLQIEDPLRRNLEEIKKAGERATALTRQLLAFSRKQVLQPKILDLNALVSEMEKMLRRLIGEDIDFQTVLNPELGRIKADPGQMEQVIMNLVVNARDAMVKGGKLTIETENVYLDEEFAEQHIAVSPGPYIILAVNDTGTGMDEQTQARIFEPFFTTKEVGKGTGLGLSTVYGIIRQSGGNIWVYSEIGRGTTFKVYLPRFDEGAQEFKRKAEVQDALQGTETILLTEDEEVVRKLSVRVLEMFGYQVLAAADGEAALRICERYEKPIHLLISDVIMPGMSGYDLADHLSRLRPAMKLLLMSGYTNDATILQRILNEGVNFIQKPFTPNALAHKVREVLDK